MKCAIALLFTLEKLYVIVVKLWNQTGAQTTYVWAPVLLTISVILYKMIKLLDTQFSHL